MAFSLGSTSHAHLHAQIRTRARAFLSRFASFPRKPSPVPRMFTHREKESKPHPDKIKQKQNTGNKLNFIYLIVKYITNQNKCNKYKKNFNLISSCYLNKL